MVVPGGAEREAVAVVSAIITLNFNTALSIKRDNCDLNSRVQKGDDTSKKVAAQTAGKPPDLLRAMGGGLFSSSNYVVLLSWPPAGAPYTAFMEMCFFSPA